MTTEVLICTWTAAIWRLNNVQYKKKRFFVFYSRHVFTLTFSTFLFLKYVGLVKCNAWKLNKQKSNTTNANSSVSF